MESRILRRNNINRICSSQEYFCRLRLYRATDAIIYFSFAFYIPTFYFWRKVVETSFAFVEEKPFSNTKGFGLSDINDEPGIGQASSSFVFAAGSVQLWWFFRGVEDTWPLMAGQLLAYSFLAFPLVLFCWTLQPSLRGDVLWEWSGPPAASFEVDRAKQVLFIHSIAAFISLPFSTRRHIWATKLILSQSILYKSFSSSPMS